MLDIKSIVKGTQIIVTSVQYEATFHNISSNIIS